MKAVLVLCYSNLQRLLCLPISYQARDSHQHGNRCLFSLHVFWASGGDRRASWEIRTTATKDSTSVSFQWTTKKVTLLPVFSTSLLCIFPLLSPLCCFILFTASGLLSPLMSLRPLLGRPAWWCVIIWCDFGAHHCTWTYAPIFSLFDPFCQLI